MIRGFAARLAWREGRAAYGRLSVFVSSIALGVGSLVAIHSFRADVQRSIGEQARALLGADVRVQGGFVTTKPRISVIVNVRAGYWKKHPGEWSRLRDSPGSSMQLFPTESLDSLGQLFSKGLLPSDPETPAVDVIAGGDGTLCQFLSWRRVHGGGARAPRP